MYKFLNLHHGVNKKRIRFGQEKIIHSLNNEYISKKYEGHIGHFCQFELVTNFKCVTNWTFMRCQSIC